MNSPVIKSEQAITKLQDQRYEPTAKEIANVISVKFYVDYDTARHWIIDAAKVLRGAS